MNRDTVEEEDVPNERDETQGGEKSELEHEVQLLFKDEELEVVKAPGDGSCLFQAVQVSTKINAKQPRQMAAEAVVTNADVEFNGISIRQWIFNETKMTSEDYATTMRDNKWGGQIELWLLAKCLNTPIGV